MRTGKRVRMNSRGERIQIRSRQEDQGLMLNMPALLVRSRSIFERALDVDATNTKLWLSYTEMVC